MKKVCIILVCLLSGILCFSVNSIPKTVRNNARSRRMLMILHQALEVEPLLLPESSEQSPEYRLECQKALSTYCRRCTLPIVSQGGPISCFARDSELVLDAWGNPFNVCSSDEVVKNGFLALVRSTVNGVAIWSSGKDGKDNQGEGDDVLYPRRHGDGRSFDPPFGMWVESRRSNNWQNVISNACQERRCAAGFPTVNLPAYTFAISSSVKEIMSFAELWFACDGWRQEYADTRQDDIYAYENRLAVYSKRKGHVVIYAECLSSQASADKSTIVFMFSGYAPDEFFPSCYHKQIEAISREFSVKDENTK